MAKFFINRPIFASVISIIIVIAGLVAVQVLPIAQYPQIAPPTVLITATYPGASAETLAKTVAAPIEEQLNGVENMVYFTSSASANGAVTITATFEVGTDVDMAAVNVNNRVKAAEPRLPEVVRRNGVIVQKRSNDILNVVALKSDQGRYSTLFLSNYASLNIVDELKRLKGVGDVTIFGAHFIKRFFDAHGVADPRRHSAPAPLIKAMAVPFPNPGRARFQAVPAPNWLIEHHCGARLPQSGANLPLIPGNLRPCGPIIAAWRAAS